MIGSTPSSSYSRSLRAPAICAAAALAAVCLALALSSASSSAATNASSDPLCAHIASGEKCYAGNGKKLIGCSTCVSHKGWPRVTGVIWQVTEDKRAVHGFLGGAANDELLGRHGTDLIAGLGGDDIIWGDSQGNNNGPHQHDYLFAGDGNDWVFASHGTNTIDAGPGNDHITAFFGRGTVDCGSGHDTIRVHPGKRRYKLKHCETITH